MRPAISSLSQGNSSFLMNTILCFNYLFENRLFHLLFLTLKPIMMFLSDEQRCFNQCLKIPGRLHRLDLDEKDTVFSERKLSAPESKVDLRHRHVFLVPQQTQIEDGISRIKKTFVCIFSFYMPVISNELLLHPKEGKIIPTGS